MKPAQAATDRRIAFWLGACLLAYYLLIAGGHHYTIDGIITFEVARSLLFDGRLIFDPPLRWWGADYSVGHWGIGQSLGYLVVLLVSYPLFLIVPAWKEVPRDPTLFANPELHTNVPYLLASGLNPVLTAATGALVYRLARFLSFSQRQSVAIAFAYGLATPAATYSRYDFSQPYAALGLTAVTLLLLRAFAAEPHRALRLVSAGLVLGLLVLTRIEFLVLLPVVLSWIFAHAGHGLGRRLTTSVLFAAPVLASFQAYRMIEAVKYPGAGRFASSSAFGDQLAQWFRFSPSAVAEGFSGLLVSPGRGLLIFSPLVILAIPGLLNPVLRRAGASWLFAGLLIVPLALYSAFAMWWAGVSWGPRFLVPFLPMLTIAAGAYVFLNDGSPAPGRRRIFALLCALGVVISWNGMVLDPTEFYIRHAGRFLPDVAATQFEWLASPLVTGWADAARQAPDLLWVQLLRPAGSECVARLAASFGHSTSIDLMRDGPAIGLTASVMLILCFVAAAARLRTMLATQTSLPSRSASA